MNEPSPVSTSPAPDPTGSEARRSRAELAREVGRRRTFAIISHPDAGKTTLTEKLLLYGGALHLAGSVKARRAARHATSDWMEMEKERGISITSSVLHFDYEGFRINLLDTPGHQDFSEDTYRALTAADSAIMLLDNRRGVETQTRKLFDVCRRRRLPIFTFVNKCDREGEDPFKLIDDVQADLGIRCFAATWPVRQGGRLVGIVDRSERTLHLYDRNEDHGGTRVEDRTFDLEDPQLEDLLGPAVLGPLREELELLEAAGEAADPEEVAAGEATPVYFGSALTNVGVELLLSRFLAQAPPPVARTSHGEPVDPIDAPFSGFVFKIQANMDPKHRDRVAFLRVCSGVFEAGVDATVTRSGQKIRLSEPQEFQARQRTHVATAVAGDVVGLHDRGSLRVGDTLAVFDVEYTGVPRFSPEEFAQVRLEEPGRRKQLDTGLRHLAEEGAILLLYSDSLTGPIPLVGAVGRLQFEVLVDRLAREYGVDISLQPLPFHCARWVTGEPGDLKRASGLYGRRLVEDADGHPMLLFQNEYALGRVDPAEERITLHAVQPARPDKRRR